MIAELQFLLADRADIDAYRTQPILSSQEPQSQKSSYLQESFLI
jgi:hypothetical protein